MVLCIARSGPPFCNQAWWANVTSSALSGSFFGFFDGSLSGKATDFQGILRCFWKSWHLLSFLQMWSQELHAKAFKENATSVRMCVPIWKLGDKNNKCVYSSKIEAVVEISQGPAPCSPLYAVVVTQLVDTVHSGLRLIVVQDHHRLSRPLINLLLVMHAG